MPLGANKVALYGASADTGTAVLLSTATASSSASIEFTLPTSYKQVKFGFYNIYPATDAAEFTFQVDASGGSSFNKTMTTTVFRAYHFESDGAAVLGYDTGGDQAQGTAYQQLALDVDGDADSSLAGELTLYNPASTTYVKHFTSRIPYSYDGGANFDMFNAGYINEGSTAIGEISFKFSSGAITSGTIKMWGIK